ncbi:MAG: transposase [Gemmatimonadetes bacterium]|nr:transposase [Gemmatimonadota bacterium]
MDAITLKKVLQIQLLPNTAQAALLEGTMHRFNEAANWLAERAYERRCANRYALHKLFYGDLRARFGLKAQQACLVCARVAGAYKRDKSQRVRFGPLAAVPYDTRLLNYKGFDRVSLATLSGRVVVPMQMGQYQADQWVNIKLYAQLVRRRDGKWFLMATVETTPEPPVEPDDFLGVDLGVENIAADSDGQRHTSEPVERVRLKVSTLKQCLQSKADRKPNARTRKALRRKLKRIGDREARFRRHVNHCLGKLLVAKAKGTGRGLTVEDLTGIRDRTRFRKPQRAKMASWSFGQLRTFLAYKAHQAGVLLMAVDPRNTSRTCAECGHCAKGNRPSQSEFCCRLCGHEDHADVNAARNIRATATRKLAALLDVGPTAQAVAE